MHRSQLKAMPAGFASKITPRAVCCPAFPMNTGENISFTTPSNLSGPGATSHTDVKSQTQIQDMDRQ